MPKGVTYNQTQANQAEAIADAITTPELEYLSNVISSSGDNTIIPAPGVGLRIVIISLIIQLEAAASTTVLIKSGASTTRKRILCQSQGDGLFLEYPIKRGLKLITNQAFILNLSGANTVGYSVEYYLEQI